MGFRGEEYIWKDRKRFFGMPLSFTRYAMSDDRLFLSKGLFCVKDEEVLLYRIQDISMTRHLGQRLLGLGTILIESRDKTSPHLELRNIRSPKQVKELLHQQVEEAKRRRRAEMGALGGRLREDEELD